MKFYCTNNKREKLSTTKTLTGLFVFVVVVGGGAAVVDKIDKADFSNVSVVTCLFVKHD